MTEHGHQYSESDDEENEEVFILDEDPDQEPTDEEIFGYAQFLGFDIENDEDLIYIAYEALQQPLPPNWKRAYLKNSNRMCYIDLTTEQFHMYSPIDEEAMEKYDSLRKQKTKKKGAVIPPKNKGLPPLGKEGKEWFNEEKQLKGGLKKGLEIHEKGKKEDDVIKEKSKKKKGKKKPIKEDIHLEDQKKKDKFDQEDNEIKEEIESPIEEKVIRKIPDCSPIIPDVFSDSGNLKELENILNVDSKVKVFDQKEDIFFDKSDNRHNYDDLRNPSDDKKNDSKFISTSVDRDSKLKNKDKCINNFEKTTDKNTIDSKLEERMDKTNFNTKHETQKDFSPRKNELIESSSSSLLENQRRKYFNDKMQEVKQFELQLKEKFKTEQSIYKDKKAQLKAELQEYYENEVEKESENIENDFNNQLQNSLYNLEVIHKNEMKNDLIALQNKLDKERALMNEKKENIENKYTAIMNEKTEILGELDFYSKLQESSNKSSELSEQELSEGRNLLEDKFNIELKNIERKYDNLEEEMKIDEEIKFNKEIENIQRSVNSNLERQEKTFKSFFGKILDDYQKALDEDFQIQAKAIAKEADDRLLSEYLRKTSEFEKAYFNEISLYRENLRVLNETKDLLLEKKFEKIIRIYENHKREIIIRIDEIVENFLNHVKDIKSQDEFETKFEEYVLYNLDVNNLSSQRKKNSYDLLEIEYKENSVLLDYFLEIGAEIIKKFRDCNIKNDNFLLNRSVWDNEKIYDELYRITKEKHKKFKEQFSLIKDKKIFEINEFKKPMVYSFNEKPMKQTGFSDINLTKSVRHSFNNNYNPFTFKNDQTMKNELRASDYIQVNMSKHELRFNNDRDLVNTELDFKKSTDGFKKIDRYTDRMDYNSTKGNFFKSTSFFNQTSRNNVSEIVMRFEEPDKTNFTIIQNFIKIEKAFVEKELADLNNEKTLSEMLKQAVKRNTLPNEIKESIGFISNYKSLNNSQSNYYNIIEEEKEKIKMKLMKVERKQIILEKIEGYYDEFYNFLRTCDLNILSEETISEKIKLIISLIDDYKKNFYEISTYPEKAIDQEFYTSRNKLKHSFQDFHPVSQREPSVSLRNTNKEQNTPESSFSNFIKFYDRNTLHNDFKSPSTNQYFNYKKSLNNIDEKLEFINSTARHKDF